MLRLNPQHTGRYLSILSFCCLAGFLCFDTAAADNSDPANVARRILEETGVQGGLVVHLGCDDGRLTAALHANDRYLVHGLDADPKNVQRARKHIESLGVYGDVSVDRLIGRNLPYVDNLVSLVVAEELGPVPMQDVMRVLAPEGVAYINQDGVWTKTVKSRPKDIDDWSHYLHDAGGNAVAADLQVGPPKHVRWVADPLWSRSHEFNPSMNSVVTAGGRMFYIFDEGMIGLTDLRFPARWAIYARDAFSGKFLWKQPMPNWGYREWNTRGMWSAPLTLNRRVVTDGERVFVTLGYKAPLTVLDAATGKTIRTVAGTNGTDEMILSDGVVLLSVRDTLSVASPPTEAQKKKQKRRLNPHEYTIAAPGPAAIVAVDAKTGSVLWKLEPQPVTVMTLAAKDDRVCFYGAQRITCSDLKTGKPLWDTATRPARGPKHSGGTLVMHEDVVLFTSGDGLTALSAKTGEKLWSGPKMQGPGVTHTADLFVADGLVWGGYLAGSHSRERTTVQRQGFDLRTGAVKRTVDVPKLISPLHHFRCYRSKATDRYLLLPKRGVEFLDLQGDNHMRHDWLRAMCHYGFLPSNGLLYVPPSHCFCYPGVKMTGFLALAAKEQSAESGEQRAEGGKRTSRLERGPAFGRALGPQPSTLDPSTDWPTYRGDSLRSGHTKTAVPAELKKAWQTELGGKVTPPVIANGKIYVAQSDAHRICCLDAKSGQLGWTFTAGARIDSPPTIHEGLALFGCCDGWVYCLRANDGELVWRFRAAPEDRRIVAFDQIESPWPVPGNVLVFDGVAYVSAGRSSFLDGGVRLYGLKPQTGELLYQTCVDGPWSDAQNDVGRPFDMEGTKSDILVTDGTHLFLFQMAFDKELNDVTAERASTLGDRKAGRHLIATGGFLDNTWFDRLFWSYSNRWPGFYYANDAPKAGQILVFDDETTYGLHVFTDRLRLSPAFTPGGDGYELFADDNDNEPILAEKSIDREKGPGFSRAAPPKWSKQVPLRAQAMVLADDRLFMAGTPDVVPEDDPYAAFEGRKGAQLWVVSATDGYKLAQYPLESLPAFDGLIAAAGRLYLVTADGKLLCFAKR